MNDHEKYFGEFVERVSRVIRDKWPASLKPEINPFTRAREINPELMSKYDSQGDEVNSLWLNRSPLEQFKEACTAWGRTVLEIHRLFAVEMKGKDAV
jgi:hypothetical protein